MVRWGEDEVVVESDVDGYTQRIGYAPVKCYNSPHLTLQQLSQRVEVHQRGKRLGDRVVSLRDLIQIQLLVLRFGMRQFTLKQNISDVGDGMRDEEGGIVGSDRDTWEASEIGEKQRKDRNSPFGTIKLCPLLNGPISRNEQDNSVSVILKLGISPKLRPVSQFVISHSTYLSLGDVPLMILQKIQDA